MSPQRPVNRVGTRPRRRQYPRQALLAEQGCGWPSATSRWAATLIMCVAEVASRGTEKACCGGCTVDTTTRGRAYVTCTTLRPRRPYGRRSRRRDRVLRGAGPGGRGQDVRRGRVLGHGL